MSLTIQESGSGWMAQDGLLTSFFNAYAVSEEQQMVFFTLNGRSVSGAFIKDDDTRALTIACLIELGVPYDAHWAKISGNEVRAA